MRSHAAIGMIGRELAELSGHTCSGPLIGNAVIEELVRF